MNFKLSLLLVVSMTIIQIYAQDFHCNCAACSYQGHPVGSNNWCRCCTMTFHSECDPENSERCANSIFDQSGCVRDGYYEYCNPDTGRSKSNPPSPVNPPGPPSPVNPPSPSGPVNSPGPVNPPGPTSDPDDPPDTDWPPCNCAGCRTASHIIGSPIWCTCCRSAFATDCHHNTRSCQESVFTQEGCQNNNWLERCHSRDPGVLPVQNQDDQGNSLAVLAVVGLVGLVMAVMIIGVTVLYLIERDHRRQRIVSL